MEGSLEIPAEIPSNLLNTSFHHSLTRSCIDRGNILLPVCFEFAESDLEQAI